MTYSTNDAEARMDEPIKIRTGYFSKMKGMPKEARVGHCRKPPQWFTGDNVLDFAPSERTFKAAKGGADNWRELYLEDLNERFPSAGELERKLRQVAAGRTLLIFLCFEHDRDECHRAVFGAYVEYLLGPAWHVEEWTAAEGEAAGQIGMF